MKEQKKKQILDELEKYGVNLKDIEEKFILGSGAGGQKVQKTHSSVMLNYKSSEGEIFQTKVSTSRSRDENRFLARRELLHWLMERAGEKSPKQAKEEKLKKAKQNKQQKAQKKYGSKEKEKSDPNTPVLPMRVAIIGRGALGKLYLKNLSSFAEVEHFHGKNIKKLKNAAPFHLILLTIKSQQVDEYEFYLREHFEQIQKGQVPLETTHLITLQNGFYAFEQIEKLCAPYKNVKALCGICREGAYLDHLGEVHWPAQNSTAVDAQFFDSIEIIYLFSLSPMKLEVEENFLNKRVKKMLLNCVANPLAGLMGVNNGELLNPEKSYLQDWVRDLAREAFSILKAQFPEASFEDNFDKYELALSALETVKDNFCSMYSDFDRGTPTEIDYFSGALLKYYQNFSAGIKAQVGAPLATEKMYQLIKKVEAFQFAPDEIKAARAQIIDGPPSHHPRPQK